VWQMRKSERREIMNRHTHKKQQQARTNFLIYHGKPWSASKSMPDPRR
jgi:hypothetical protein